MLPIRKLLRMLCFHSSDPKAHATESYVCQKVMQKETPLARPLSSLIPRAEKRTVDENEIKEFKSFEKIWWNIDALHVLHALNTVRVPVIRDGILRTYAPQYVNTVKPLEGINLLDVGCGGGILAESLARLGAHVTGVDPVVESIEVARRHSELDPEIRDNLEYVCGTPEDLCKESKQYDAVICSEVLDHVDSVPYFIKCCVDLSADNGYLHFSTINRTVFAYIYVIFLAENVFRFIPRGAHHLHKFIKPQELRLMLETHDCTIFHTHGTFYNPVSKACYKIPYNGGFYSFCALKGKPENGISQNTYRYNFLDVQ